MAQLPPEIFISYRREDWGYGGRLHADLAARFGEEAVFYDLHGIPFVLAGERRTSMGLHPPRRPVASR